MRADQRRLRLLIATMAALAALAGTGIPAAAAAAGSGRTSPAAGVFPTTSQAHASARRPPANPTKLTTDTNAPCNTKPKKGHVQCFAVVRTPANHVITPDASGPPSGALGPSGIQSAYNLPAGGGAGQTVAIVDAGDDASAESDLAEFRAYYGLPACTTANGCFEKVNQQGQQGSYPPDAGWGDEISLDLDAVSSACPACHILLVEASSATLGDVYAAEDEAVALGAKYISNSYGTSEYSGETTDDQHYNHPGVAITVAAGDGGYGAQYPSSSPYVTSVGGTKLTKDPSAARGWTETVWNELANGHGATGSGCSQYEPQPAFQQNIPSLDAACSNRATADVSADADPYSGLGIYDTDGESGWLQVGGTSLATPLIAAIYAQAGTPVVDSYPNTYPYQAGASAGLFDITAGNNGSCGTNTVLCTAGPGWDGPTGMGTPNGPAALSGGPAGTLSGTVTDKVTGKPIAGATVTATGGYTSTTNASGTYTMFLPAGSYSVTEHAFGYAGQSQSGIQVSNRSTTTDNATLTSVPDTTLSGKVTDGSGHGWPLYAKITVAGTPLKPIYTSPYTGRYHVKLPQQASYTLQVTPVRFGGYDPDTETVQVATSAVKHNIALIADLQACTAPGYAWSYGGANTGFTGWTGDTPQSGWTVSGTTGVAGAWQFGDPFVGDPFGSGEPPASDGQFAISGDIPSPYGSVDTSLVSPIVNLSGVTSPDIGFDTHYEEFQGQTADVDLSLDGGQTWTTVWQQTSMTVQGPVAIPIPQAAGRPDVQVRFRFTADNGWWWSLDNVYVGSRSCGRAAGGLVAGTVTDANTGSALNGASVAAPAASAVTAMTPGDPRVPNGFYELFSPHTGSTSLTARYRVTATGGRYAPGKAATGVAANGVARQDFALKAGRLTVTQNSISATGPMGGSAAAKVTYSNDGSAPVHVRLGARETAVTSAAGPAHPHAIAPASGPEPASTAASWVSLRHLPVKMSEGDIVAHHGGQVYVVGGLATRVGVFRASGYAYDPYDPGGQQWRPIAPLPHGIGQASGGFVGDRLYVAGGWYDDGGLTTVSSAVYAYNPVSNSWSQVASLPHVVAYAAAAVLGGKLYVIGGCGSLVGVHCPVLASVYRYNPASNTWTRLARYPAPVDMEACGGVDGEIVCAGGSVHVRLSSGTFIYHPLSNTWTKGPKMPYPNAAMAYGTANGKLIVVSGESHHDDAFPDNVIVQTSRAAAYDPATGTWSALPDINPDYTSLQGGGGCGFYYIGGYNFTNSAGSGYGNSLSQVEVLPGYNQCGSADQVPWLSDSSPQFTLQPGQSATVTVTLNSAKGVSQPGTYDGLLFAMTDSPYLTQPVQATMTVKPPAKWGGITGTVTDATTGKPITGPINGATIQVCSVSAGGTCTKVLDTLKTDSSGHYSLWLDTSASPLQLIVSADHYIQQIRVIKVQPRTAKTVNFALRRG